VVTVVPAPIGTAYGAVFDLLNQEQEPRHRVAFIGFGEESAATNPCLNLFEVGRPGKNVAGGLA
jgi:hypothetical protein